ncbi:uncharacterized protein [Musca autumnalis]|uniref:uncharacterized protein n=1 Tax=Musca autumnalis TaxID=221902 RepID=UPI003CF5AE5F
MKFITGLAAIIVLFVSSKLMKTKGSLTLKQTWTYELKSVESHTDNSDLLGFSDWKIDRISRGQYAISGSISINVDIVDGDSNEVEFKAYRSENGVKEYKPIPFEVQRQHVYEYINTFYKDLIMESLSKCSNLPVFEDKFEPPLQKITYTLDKCQLSQEGFPQHLQDGFYKVVMKGFGSANWDIIFIVEVQNNI